MLSKFALVAVLSLNVAFGATIVASGAGPLPGSAENLTNQFPSEILGALDFPNGVNMFAITISNYLTFSAMTVPVGPHAVPDTELFLFDSTGHGLYANDDIDGANTLSCLPSADAANPCSFGRAGLGPTSNGTYYLAITRSANGPLSNSGEIFSALTTGAVAGVDLTQGGAGSIVGWDNGVFTSSDFDNVNYEIVLTGTVPEPATLGLLGISVFALLLVRRKFAIN